MISITEKVLQEISSLTESYTPEYREYKQGLLKDLNHVPPPNHKQDYWKNVNFDFLEQDWHYKEYNQINDDRLVKEHLDDLVGSNNYINVIFVNGFLHSIDKPATGESLQIEKVSGDYQKIFKKKKEIFSSFTRNNLLRNWFLSFNELLNDEVVTFRFPAGKTLKRTVRMIFITDNDSQFPITSPQIFINAEEGAKVNLIEEHFSLGRSFNNHSLKIVLGKGAVVHHFLFQNESLTSVHVNHAYVEQKEESGYYSYNLQQGGGNAIVQKTIGLIEPNSTCEIYGLSRPKGNQIFNNLTTVEHLAPKTISRQLFRGILDEESFLNFTGNVRVSKDAPLTDSGQLNQNLILTKKAHAVSRPRLEIYNDDVKCTHGATCRDVNPQELFYLTSRGISPDNCRQLLIEGFAQEFLNLVRERFPEWKP